MIKDQLNFASKLTFGRIINGLKIIGSYAVSKFTKNARISGFPIALAFEPTTSCNLRCPECPSGLRSFTRDTGMLEKNLFEATILELKESLLYLTFYFQGEPYLHKDFLEMVAFAAKHKVYTATSTNAHYLDMKSAIKTVESGLDRLIISIDGTSQDTYEQYRVGGKIDKVIEGTKNIIAAKKQLKSATPLVIFQFLVVKPNEHQLDEVKNLANELGVDEVRFKTAQIYDYENGSDLIPTIEKYSRYKANGDGTYRIKNKLINHCWKMWHSCVITWDGKVIPCCFDKDAHYHLGSVGDITFNEVWNSDVYANFRQNLIKSRSEIEMCKNCTEGTPVWG